MLKALNKTMVALALGATALGGIVATPALADPPEGRGWKKDRHDDRHDRRYDRRADRRDDRRDDRRYDRRDDRRYDNRRPVIVYNYDYNRPDPHYRGYYANRYYRPYNNYGYAPIRVTRETRIYRGDDDRYYCRRSDGTTGLIVGAVLGGVLGDQIDRGRSSILGAVLGAGAGAMIGQSIDRGNVQCR